MVYTNSQQVKVSVVFFRRCLVPPDAVKNKPVQSTSSHGIFTNGHLQPLVL